MRKCVIFGCGNIGTVSYRKIKELYEVVAWSDNNKELWGKKKDSIEIVDPTKLVAMQQEGELVVIIAIYDCAVVLNQLMKLEIKRIMLWKEGLLYEVTGKRNLRQVVDEEQNRVRRKGVLFVQCEACIRTNKIAKAIKCTGRDVYLAYLYAPPGELNGEYADIYNEIIPIKSFRDLEILVNDNDFDYVHSSNEPNILTMAMIKTNKILIHDCHDLSSAYKKMTPEEMTIEYIANTQSDGVIYTTEIIREAAIKRFNIPREKTFVLENYVSEDLKPEWHMEKISHMDGAMHCVYEGAIVPHIQESHRYFERIFKRIAESGAHVHFYTHCEKEYCSFLENLHPNIHFEGNCSSQKLAYELSKYDVGLCVLNVTDRNRQFLEGASPNKIQEYVNAGIPVAVGDVKSEIEFVEKHSFGTYLDLNGDILSQLEEIKKIRIEDDILGKQGLTIESRIRDLIDFVNLVGNNR